MMKRLLLTFVMMVTVVFAANAQQSQYYDYIKNIQPSVDKYYPQYSAYFKNVLAKFKDYGTAEKYLINKWICEDLNTYKKYDKITSNIDETATALIVFDYLEGESKFIKDRTIIHKQSDGSEDIKIEAANGILKGIKWEYDRFHRDWEKYENELKEISKSIKQGANDKNTLATIEYNEEIMRRFKEYHINAGMMKESSNIQNWVLSYEKLIKITGRQPSEIGKLYIQEYNKIKNKK